MTSGMTTATTAEQPTGHTGTGTRTGTDQRGRNQWVFHLVAALVCAGATVVAFVAAVVVSFGTSVCNESDTSQELGQLRLGLLVIGGLLTMVPTLSAVAAAKLRFVWLPWAVLAVVSALATFVVVVGAEVSTWCMF